YAQRPKNRSAQTQLATSSQFPLNRNPQISRSENPLLKPSPVPFTGEDAERASAKPVRVLIACHGATFDYARLALPARGEFPAKHRRNCPISGDSRIESREIFASSIPS